MKGPMISLGFSYRSRRIVLFPVCSFMSTLVYWMLLSSLPIHLKELNVPDLRVGAIMGTYSIATLLLMLPLGMLSDRISPKRVLLAGSVVAWGHVLGLRMAQQTWHFLLLAAAGGIGWAIFQIVLLALYLKVISDENRGKKIALYQAGQFLGFGVGPLLAGVLWQHLNYSHMLAFATGAGIILNLCVFGLLDSPPIPFRLGDYKKDIAQPRALLLLVIYFIYSTHFGVEQTAYTLFMRQELAFTGQAIGLTFFVVGVWMAFLAPLAGHGFDLRQSVLLLLIFGLLTSATFQIWTGWVQHLPGMILIRLLHTMGDVPVIMAVGIMTAAFFPQGRMGGNSAVVYMVRTLGVFSGNLMAGFLAPFIGYGGVFIYTGFFMLLASVSLFPLMQRRLVFPVKAGKPGT